mmetsp:Transcript_21228/g.38563  ORF Transcript_21228/g.38563 Transcript_21228/m.38563 type:complete len:309 (-) Transcript_21228:68-994(-)
MGNLPLMWMDCPAASRLVIVGYPVISFSVFVLLKVLPTFPVARIFGCSLLNIHDLCLWTLATSSFFEPFVGGLGLLFILIEVFMMLQYFPNKERELGSFAFLLWIILAGVVVNLMFLAFMAAMIGFAELLQNQIMELVFYEAPNAGMWPLIMAALSLNSLSDPDGAINFWGVIQVPNKWYPIFFVGLFCLINTAMMWNLVAGVFVGYTIFAFPCLHFERLLPSQAVLSSCDQRCCGSCLGGAWMAAGSTGDASSGLPPYSQWGQPQQSTPATRPVGGRPAVFSGAGHRLGAGPSNPPRRNLEQGLLNN